jgi:hypothetical protein
MRALEDSSLFNIIGMIMCFLVVLLYAIIFYFVITKVWMVNVETLSSPEYKKKWGTLYEGF